MLYSVKSFGNVKFDNKDRPLGLVTLKQIFQGPGNTILNGSTFKKDIPILMNTPQDHMLQTIG